MSNNREFALNLRKKLKRKLNRRSSCYRTMNPNDREDVKLILVGDASVGKSSIVNRYVNGSFTEPTAPTVGAAFVSKNYDIGGKSYTMNIWDTAGQEAYRYLVPMYYRSASVAILVFDVTAPNSFDAIPSWIEDINKAIGDSVIMILCGNKCDLEEKRAVPNDDAVQEASRWGTPYVETSALNGEGINKLFELAMSEYRKRGVTTDNSGDKVAINKKENHKSGCC